MGAQIHHCVPASSAVLNVMTLLLLGLVLMVLPYHYDAAELRTTPIPPAGRTLRGPSSFTFYMHKTVDNPTVDNANKFNFVYGLLPNVTWPNPYSFGTTATFKDAITSGPSNSLQQIGVAQGI
ncbi:hypothetical protein L7F22_049822 [Adiantum nelumboides]|nr:hypothetical protein [Adiantum nelumboides]MCO5595774.1 hypothetical protein [Adiantum nelumboides]